MRMLSHVSELPCLTLPIRLVCPLADRKPSKQNSCPWQYKMSLYRRLLTVTLDREEPVLKMFLLSFTTDLTDWTDLNPLNLLNLLNLYLGHKTKT